MEYLTKQSHFQHTAVSNWNFLIIVSHYQSDIGNDIDGMPGIRAKVCA